MIEKNIGQKTQAAHNFLAAMISPNIRAVTGKETSEVFGAMRRLIISRLEELGGQDFFNAVAKALTDFEIAVADQPEPTKISHIPSHLKQEFDDLAHAEISDITIEALDILNEAGVPLSVALVYAKARELCQKEMNQ